MKRLRMIRRFVRVLVVLFVVAQFAGVVSSPLAMAHAAPSAAAAHVDHQHADGHGRGGCPHRDGDRSGDRADYCCALHAFFAGILPPAIAVASADIVGERLLPQVTALGLGVNPGLLDRPPRPLP
jgi:hypothetical protein